MRISTQQFHQAATDRLVQNGAAAGRTQREISLGRRLISNADDPAAATRVLSLERAASERTQHLGNINRAEATLGREETVLKRTADIYQRMRELTVQAGNVVLSPVDRGLLGAEIETLRGELVQLANSRDTEGQYLFAGSASDTLPFPGGQWVGMADQREVNVGANLRVAVSDNGFDVFENIPLGTPRFTVTPHPSNTGTSEHALEPAGVADADTLAAFHPGRLEITFEASGMTVRNAADGTVVDELEDSEFTVGEPFVAAGMSLRVLSEPEPGDRFVVDTVDHQSVFASIDELVRGLRNPALDQAAVGAIVDDGLDNLDAALEVSIDMRTRVGTRLSTLEQTRELHLDVQLAERKLIADLSDLDYAEAVSRLSFQSFILEASQQSFARLANISLFDRL